EYAQKKLETVLAVDRRAAMDAIVELDSELRSKQAQLEEYFNFIQGANEPTILPEGQFEKLLQIAGEKYVDPRGSEHKLITSAEVQSLSIPKGSLSDQERRQIESHVSHSFNFLRRIPWTRDLSNIPWIAGAHHEKLNGTGYPYGLHASEIPVQ